eukprot:30928-Pelagococcus_subviridis.AAC.9
MRRLLDVSRLSGGSYPRMVEDGLDPIAPVSVAGDPPRGSRGDDGEELAACGLCVGSRGGGVVVGKKSGGRSRDA